MTSLLLEVLAGRAVPRPPIWLMRQAGRYLPEYRALRTKAETFLAFCYTPELAVEATMQPIRRYGLDAAILFSDILVIPDALGSRITFDEGPKLVPIEDAAGVARLSSVNLHAHLAPVYETVARLRASLPAETALIGFAGAPWTLAAYMVEGQGSKEFLAARRFARRDPAGFGALIDLLTEAVSSYLLRQIDAGAQVIQLFDSWAGVLPAPEFERWCVAPAARIVQTLKAARPDVPVIGFPRGAGVQYREFARRTGVDAVSLDTTVPLEWARDALAEWAVQGNLDPVALLTGGAPLLAEAERILAAMAGRRLIFNLGHGVLPGTDPEAVAALVALVKRGPIEQKDAR